MKKQLLRIVVVLGTLPFVFSSCLDSPDITPPDYDAMLQERLRFVDQTQWKADTTAIAEFLEANEISDDDVFIDPMGGVRYTVAELGTGLKPRTKDGVAMKYEVILMSKGMEGVPFDDSDRMEAPLYNLIAAMQTTLQLIPEGSEITMFIPSGLAYGPQDIKNGNGDIVIPKNSNLIFKLELLQVYRVPD